jgi:ribosomal protein S18 acetylase RimI-like enzyme
MDVPAAGGFVRPARSGDAAELARVQVASWRSGLAGIVPEELLASLTSSEAESVWRDRWREAITNPPTSRHRVLVAVQAIGSAASAASAGSVGSVGSVGSAPRPVVGFVSEGPTTDDDRWPGTDGELYELRVAPELGGNGHWHASRLLHAAADTLAEDGFRTVSMWVLAADAPLRDFLESAGWSADGARGELDVGVSVPVLRLHAAIGHAAIGE